MSAIDIDDLYIVVGTEGQAQIMVAQETRNTVLGVRAQKPRNFKVFVPFGPPKYAKKF